VGLGGTGDSNDRRDVLVRVRDAVWAFIESGPVSMDGCGGGVEDLFSCGLLTGILGFF
jgi:hypothetical protein